MQIVSIRDYLHELSNSVLWENKKNITAEYVQRAVKINAYHEKVNSTSNQMLKGNALYNFNITNTSPIY